MSNIINCQSAAVLSLSQETQSLEKTHSNFMTVKRLAQDLFTNFMSSAEAFILGTKTPSMAVFFKVCKLIASLGLSQLFAKAMTKSGLRQVKMGTVSLELGDTTSNRPFIRTLQENAKKMNLSTQGIGGDTLGIVEADDLGTSSISMLNEKAIRCPTILYYAPKVIKQTASFISNPQGKASVLALTQNPSYPAFLGTQSLAHIRMNSYLINASVEIASLFSAKHLIRFLAERWGMNTSNFSYIALSGLFSKLAADCAGVVCNRYLCYEADKKAIEVTEDPKSAVEALKITASLETSFKEKLVLFFGMVLGSERCKNWFSLPSAESRILAIDPQGKYSHFALPLTEVSEKNDVEHLTAKKALYENALQDLWAIRPNLKASFALLLSGLFPLMTLLTQGYFNRSSSVAKLALQLGLIVMLNLYPHRFEALKSEISKKFKRDGSCPASDSQRRTAEAIALEMGIQKPIEVRTVENSEGVPYSIQGISRGPGSLLLFVPPEGKFSQEQEEAILRHEFSHALKWDTLTSQFLMLGMMSGLNRLFDSLGFQPMTHFEKLKQGFLITISALAIQKIHSRYFESRADANSVHSCSSEKKAKHIENLSAALNAFKSHNLEVIHQVADAPWVVRFTIGLFSSSTGDNYLDLDHPTISGRIQDIQAMKSQA